jgi:hypothetical protein
MRIVFLIAYGYLVKDTNLELVSGHLYGRFNHVYFPTHWLRVEHDLRQDRPEWGRSVLKDVIRSLYIKF